MKPVGSEYMEQYNALLRYVFQVTEQELSSIGWQEREIIRAKFPTMEKADVIGWFDNDTLVSQVAVYPMHVRIFGQTYAMGGLTGVGTYPEYSEHGADAQASGTGTQEYERAWTGYLLSLPLFHTVLQTQRLGNHF